LYWKRLLILNKIQSIYYNNEKFVKIIIRFSQYYHWKIIGTIIFHKNDSFLKMFIELTFNINISALQVDKFQFSKRLQCILNFVLLCLSIYCIVISIKKAMSLYRAMLLDEHSHNYVSKGFWKYWFLNNLKLLQNNIFYRYNFFLLFWNMTLYIFDFISHAVFFLMISLLNYSEYLVVFYLKKEF